MSQSEYDPKTDALDAIIARLEAIEDQLRRIADILDERMKLGG